MRHEPVLASYQSIDSIANQQAKVQVETQKYMVELGFAESKAELDLEILRNSLKFGLEDSEVVELECKYLKKKFDKLIEVGFTEAQAMNLLKR